MIDNNCYLLNIEHCKKYSMENKTDENKLLQCELCEDGYFFDFDLMICNNCHHSW